MGRIIVFTGKGGVGKTSAAAAHALKSSKEGMNTLIVSTDMAHNLSDIFVKDIHKEPTEISPKLWALEIDANYEMENSYGTIQKSISNMIKFDNEKDAETFEDIVVFPGMEELFSLLKIKELYDKNIYDIIIVDCAPTGETLSLLKFPELLSWYMENFFPVGRIAMKVFRPVGKAFFKIELPDKDTLNDIEKLYLKLLQLQQLFKDNEICSIRLVTIPEKMIVEETKRNYMYLNLYGFNVDGVYINRVIPESVDNHFFKEWKAIQKKYMKEIQAIFGNMPIYNIKWYEVDVVGLDGLERIINDSLQDKNIFKVLKQKSDERFEKEGKGYKLEVYIPFTDKSKLDMYQSDTDIIIRLGNFKRSIPVPDVMKKYFISKAKFVDDHLCIYFEEKVS
ncbi:ArsA family ATPase [Herbivorax sp. ANBcel31]|uniref:ArsA family ATPase n=1 Tax=Herbivorax sp. ANBcel31 TaxID=3069754 RepID=UPI0027AEC77A|nr:ArsA family ATPase [Herbivorax sp. ANBcel31]MDQ2087425.1 ArsA family ATPase [Herbivorax sp. ANBcel31]